MLIWSSEGLNTLTRVAMAERTSSGLLMEPPPAAAVTLPAAAVTLPAEVRERLAELELELSEGNPPTMHRTTDTCCLHVIRPG